MSEETRMYLLLEATIMTIDFFGCCLQPGAPQLSTVQYIESLLRDVVVIGWGTIDRSNGNRLVSLQVCQVPARAAELRALFDVPCAADIWEAGEISEMRVVVVEVGAGNVLGVAVPVVILVCPCDIVDDNREGVLVLRGVGIREVV